MGGMRFPISDHCDGRRFFDPEGIAARPLRDVLRWKLTSRAARWPRRVEHVAGPDPLLPAPGGTAAATFVGHSTFLVRTAGLALLTDPIWSDRAGPLRWLGPRRVHPPALPLEGLPRLDLVLVSHNHYDHLDLPTLRDLDRRHRPLVVTGLGNRAWLERRGLARVVDLDWWQVHRLPGGGTITFVPARHFSARGPHDRCRTLWGGFVVEADGVRLYFAGDSSRFPGFREIGERLGPPDLALLPIGAYDPRWFMDVVHVTPEEAVDAHVALGARRSVAMHFGTFQLTDEPIDEPADRLRAALAERGIGDEAFVIPRFGQTVTSR